MRRSMLFTSPSAASAIAGGSGISTEHSGAVEAARLERICSTSSTTRSPWIQRLFFGGWLIPGLEHNALAVDPTAPNNVYVGADIGVWHSADAGLTWEPLENGLPDAPVFDLQIHPSRRLLRAATYGRGVYELALP